MSASAYPLAWPKGRPRSMPIGGRVTGKFTHDGNPISVAVALDRLQAEIDRLGGRYPVISTNLETRLDGRPRSGQAEPADRAVALYFQLDGKPHCMPCDTYTKVSQNIAAIAAHIAATRAIQRYGVATVAEMFAGFVSLPAPGQADSQQWWKVLRIEIREGRAIKDTPVEEIQAAYRKRAAEIHPDKPGGSSFAMAELNAARDEALKAVRS